MRLLKLIRGAGAGERDARGGCASKVRSWCLVLVTGADVTTYNVWLIFVGGRLIGGVQLCGTIRYGSHSKNGLRYTLLLLCLSFLVTPPAKFGVGRPYVEAGCGTG